jgi:hypothetical protein
VGPVHPRQAGPDEQQDEARVEQHVGGDDRRVPHPELRRPGRPALEGEQDRVDEVERRGEEDERRQGDDDLRHDDADVGQGIEHDPHAFRHPLEPQRSHRPEGRREDRVPGGDPEAVLERPPGHPVPERLAEPVDAEAGPDRRQLVGVEGEHDDHDDRQVEERVDEYGVDAERAVDESTEPLRRRLGTAPANLSGGRWRRDRGRGHWWVTGR